MTRTEKKAKTGDRKLSPEKWEVSELSADLHVVSLQDMLAVMAYCLLIHAGDIGLRFQ